MATFFGSEALVDYTSFSSSVTSDATLYTVAAGTYVELFIQKIENFSGTGGIAANVNIGLYAPIVRNIPDPPAYSLTYELFPGQTFAIDVTSIIGSASLLITWRVKVYAAP